MIYTGKRRIRIGKVLSTNMDKTIIVGIETKKMHNLYKKPMKVIKKYKVHDENGLCKVGDEIRIVETRPLSKNKRWRVMEIVAKGDTA
jgi:small subunit ribosomal protein S17